jgi:hypothetical protein
LTLILVNMCAVYTVISEKVAFSVFYFLVGNLIAAQTFYLLSTRLTKLSKEIKAMSIAKDKLEIALDRSAIRMAAFERIAVTSPGQQSVVDIGVNGEDANEKEKEKQAPPVPG